MCLTGVRTLNLHNFMRLTLPSVFSLGAWGFRTGNRLAQGHRPRSEVAFPSYCPHCYLIKSDLHPHFLFWKTWGLESRYLGTNTDYTTLSQKNSGPGKGLELLGSQFLHLENEPANNTHHIRVAARLNKVHIMSSAQHLT